MHKSGSEGRVHSHGDGETRAGRAWRAWRVTPQMESTVQGLVKKHLFRHFIRSFGVSEHGAHADFRDLTLRRT